jgi:phage recombination protein Bet
MSGKKTKKEEESKKTTNGMELEVRYEIDGNEVVLTPTIVQNYLVGSQAKITAPEFKFFTELCKVRKLNPFLNEAYLIKYNSSPAQLVVGKDAILKRAVLNHAYDGMESGVIVITETGAEKYRNGTFYLDSETLVGGWARVFIKGRKEPSYASVNFSEVAGKKGSGELNSNWANKGATMVEKVAKVRALREAFVEDLGGMYEAEEFGQEAPVKSHGSDKVIIEQVEVVENEVDMNKNEEVAFDEL